MKHVLVLLLVTLLSVNVQAQNFKCVFSDGTSLDSNLPCDAAILDKFANRLTQLYPEVQQINDPDRRFIEFLFRLALGSCEEPFVHMTPEQIGKNGEPFFPWQMGAAIAQAGREVICPTVK